MSDKSIKHPGTNSVDIIKLLSCVLIIGSHCLPIFQNETLNYYYGQWLFRFCVPFFFITSGYYFAQMNVERKWKYIIRISLLYFISSILYFPLFNKDRITNILYSFVFGFHHLWYLSAIAIGLMLLLLLEKYLGRKMLIVTALLLIAGVLFDEYYKFFNLNVLSEISTLLTEYFGGPRHALLFALPMLSIGWYISANKLTINRMISSIFLIVSFVLSFFEASLLKKYIGMDITLDVSLFGWLPAIPVFFLSINCTSKLSQPTSRHLRKIIDWAYIIHLWICILSDCYYFLRFIVTVLVSFILAGLFEFLISKLHKKSFQ